MGKLYVVATPIGNLGDMSPRAVETLRGAALVVAEDTRTTGVLMRHFDIGTPLLSYHKFNEEARAPELVARLLAGEDIALVSDAGTPGISDPGQVLVRQAAESGIEVVSVPGACAFAAAVSVSGFPAAPLCFGGFLPRREKEQAVCFLQAAQSAPLVGCWYESPLRIKASLACLAAAAPEALVCLCNDLTKKHERCYRGTPEEVLALLRENSAAEKGEYALAVYFENPPKAPQAEEAPPLTPEALLVQQLAQNGGTLKNAVRLLAQQGAGGYSKNEFYQASLRLKELFGG